MVGLIGAMSVEIEGLLAQLSETKLVQQVGLDTFTVGKLFGQDVVLSVCGPGKVNAAMCAANMISCFRPDWMINLGVAGAGEDGVSIGDMVIATSAVQHDMDTSPIGDPVGFISKVGLIEIPCSDALRRALVNAAVSVPDMQTHEGIIATGDQFICDGETRARIHQLFGAKAVEMEGGAVAHVCHAMNVPFCVVRSISDQANGHSTMDYPTFTQLAASRSQQVIENLLRSMDASGNLA